jgi:hypothetical protein
MGLTLDDALRVHEVAVGGQGDRLGIRVGDVLVGMGKVALDTLEHAAALDAIRAASRPCTASFFRRSGLSGGGSQWSALSSGLAGVFGGASEALTR